MTTKNYTISKINDSKHTNMKTTLTAILLALAFFSKGQFVEENRTNSLLTVQKINMNDYKYYYVDFQRNQCIMLNTDYTIWKTINLPVPDGFYLADIGLVAQKLFNTDDKIELVYVCYSYTATSGTEGYYTYNTYIINEDGKNIHQEKGGRYAYIKEIDKNEYKLFMYAYNYEVSPYLIWTNVYPLGGTSEEIKAMFFGEENTIENLQISSLYPVPADKTIHIEYSLSTTNDNVTMSIYNTNGILVDSKQLDHSVTNLQLDCSLYQAGKYTYRIEDSFGVLQSGSFSVVHQN